MTTLNDFISKFPKVTKKQMYKSQKRLFKFRRRLKKWVKRSGCYVVSSGNTKCLECGKIEYMHRFGCKCMEIGKPHKGVVYGAALNTGAIGGKSKFDPIISESDFISYKDIYQRIKNGDRFIDLSCRKELNEGHFKGAPQ